jgi:hypothetical protein
VLTGTFIIPKATLTSSPSDTSSTTPGTPLEAAKPDEHYFTETAILSVTIDQFQINIYVGLGGLLAFLVMSISQCNYALRVCGQSVHFEQAPYGNFSSSCVRDVPLSWLA